MVVSGKLRWLGALALAGFHYPRDLHRASFLELPAGRERMMATNAFFEHLGLAGAFVLVTIFDITKGAEK